MLLRDLIPEVYIPELCANLHIEKGYRYVMFVTDGDHYHRAIQPVTTLNEALGRMIMLAEHGLHVSAFKLYQNKVDTHPTLSYYER